VNILKRYILDRVDRRELEPSAAFDLLREVTELELGQASPGSDAQPARPSADLAQPIAIVGLGCRLPKASSVPEFWANLVGGVDAVGPFPRARIEDVIRTRRSLFDAHHDRVERAAALLGGWLDDIDDFDAEFFGLNAGDALTLGPAERLFLMVGWEALENAGCRRRDLDGASLGMYIAHSPDVPFEYARVLPPDEPRAVPFNNPASTAYRLAHCLNTRGPTMVINTTCSSSLVSVHVACQALRTGECDVALCGGISLYLCPLFHDTSDPMRLLSRDGRCKAFDAEADGLSMGEGIVLFVLKPLVRALEQGDPVYGVIRGSGVASDGRSNGPTAPNPEAQTEAILRAWKQAQIDPRRIGYIEAHGAGTRLGDPVEVKGLTDAFRRYTQDRGFCGLGSVKSNISHLGDAAGAAGLLKLVLALHHRTLPPSLHYKRPNELIRFESTPFRVTSELASWNGGSEPRLGGVSSFGLSGTNCHVVVEEFTSEASACPALRSASGDEVGVLAISAPTLSALWGSFSRYADYIEAAPGMSLSQLCHSALKREPSEYRAVLFAEQLTDLRHKLRQIGELRNHDRLPEWFPERGIFAARVGAQVSESFCRVPEEDGSTASALARAFLTQREIDVDRFYPGGPHPRLSLPNTPFSMRRHWPVHEVPAAIDASEYFFDTRWVTKTRSGGGAALRTGLWVVLGDEKPFTLALLRELTERGADVMLLQVSDRFEARGDRISLDPALASHFEKAASHIASVAQGALGGIIHAWTSGPPEDEMASLEALTRSQDLGSLGVFRLFRALAARNLGTDAEFVVVPALAHAVDGSERRLSPARVATCGVVTVISQEHPLVAPLAIDLGSLAEIPDEAAKTVLDELSQERHDRDELVAFRSGSRWVKVLERASAEPAERQEYRARSGGVYVIAGGTGALGTEIARCLASRERVKLVLLSRTPMPAREQWDNIDPRSNLARVVAGIRDIEKLGSEVVHAVADVTDPVQVAAAFRRIHAQFQRIDGVVVAMKQLAHRKILQITEEEFISGIMNRVHGNWLLERATAEYDLDFFLMISSISSLMGAQTAAECCAVNQYLDEYPAYLACSGRKAMTLNLSLVLDDLRDFRGATPIPPLDAREFEACLQEFLSRRRPFGVVAKFDADELRAVYSVLKLRLSDGLARDMGVADVAQHPAAAVESPAFTPAKGAAGHGQPTQDTVERELFAFLGEIIGYRGAARTQSFFALGGTSLTALRLAQKIRERWHVSFEASDMYAYPTVEAMARHIAEKLPKAEGAAPTDPVHQAIAGVASGALSLDEALRALRKAG
jgi:acyl transferase domain-containing protein